MAGFFQQALKGAVEGFFNDAYLRDFKHASKTFTTDGFANAPKFKYLFHVYFEINETLVNSGIFPDPKIPGLLVKNINLPKFNMTVAEMNQYNRKRYVQTKINYDPVTITFHDDNAGAIKRVWFNYYRYYYNDPTTTSANTNSVNNTYADDITIEQNWGYSGEPTNSVSAASIGIPKPQFFKSIKIYGFNQHNFSLYTLVNPIIERFDHDTYDYYQPTGTMENRMTVRYESVRYEEGAINGDSPSEKIPSFGTDDYYDRTLSPISQPGGNKSIMGQGGLVDGGLGILGDLSQIPSDPAAAIGKALNIGRTWKNPAEILTASKSAIVAGALSAASNPAIGRSAFNFASEGTSNLVGAITSGSNNVPNTNAPPVTPPTQ